MGIYHPCLWVSRNGLSKFLPSIRLLIGHRCSFKMSSISSHICQPYGRPTYIIFVLGHGGNLVNATRSKIQLATYHNRLQESCGWHRHSPLLPRSSSYMAFKLHLKPPLHCSTVFYWIFVYLSATLAGISHGFESQPHQHPSESLSLNFLLLSSDSSSTWTTWDAPSSCSVHLMQPFCSEYNPLTLVTFHGSWRLSLEFVVQVLYQIAILHIYRFIHGVIQSTGLFAYAAQLHMLRNQHRLWNKLSPWLVWSCLRLANHWALFLTSFHHTTSMAIFVFLSSKHHIRVKHSHRCVIEAILRIPPKEKAGFSWVLM